VKKPVKKHVKKPVKKPMNILMPRMLLTAGLISRRNNITINFQTPVH